jgi:hypothetical protein
MIRQRGSQNRTAPVSKSASPFVRTELLNALCPGNCVGEADLHDMPDGSGVLRLLPRSSSETGTAITSCQIRSAYTADAEYNPDVVVLKRQENIPDV